MTDEEVEVEGLLTLARRVQDFAAICRNAYTPELDGVHRIRTEEGDIITGSAADCMCELVEGVIALGELARSAITALDAFRAGREKVG